MADQRLASAARIADRFNLDPVTVYGETDVVRWMVRVASYNVIARDQKEQAEKSKRKK